jgi:hypothetical protein
MDSLIVLTAITIVGIVLGIALVANTVLNHSRHNSRRKLLELRNLELRNEELRLRLMMEQQKNSDRVGAPVADFVAPKDPSWEELTQTSYEMGYQQQRQSF